MPDTDVFAAIDGAIANAAAFAVPESFLPAEARRTLRKKRVAAKPAEAAVDDYEIGIVLVKVGGKRSRGDAVRAVLEAAARQPDALTVETCSVAGAPTPFILPKEGAVEVHDHDPLATEEERKKLAPAIDAYRVILGRLSRLAGGRKVHFHHGNGFVREPYPDDDPDLHVMTNAGPPGEYGYRYLSLAFGMDISESALFSVRCRGPAKGRGAVVSDKEEGIVQVLGPNVYFLVPTLTNFRPQTSEKLFTLLLTKGWNALRAQAREAEDGGAGREEYLEECRGWVTNMIEIHRKAHRDNDAKIQQIQSDLAVLLRYKQELAAIISTFATSASVKEALARLPRDFRAIKELPLVRRVTVAEKGVHVETELVVAEHEGKEYALGRYVIRIGHLGAVSVWCVDYAHPGRVPHPHIHKDGGTCYGNATEAISKHASQFRFLDCVTLVLRWLATGYTAKLASTKIEEWPEHVVIDLASSEGPAVVGRKTDLPAARDLASPPRETVDLRDPEDAGPAAIAAGEGGAS